MDIEKLLATDEKKEAGVWTDLGLGGEARFRIAHIGRDEYLKERLVLLRQFRDELNSDDPEKVAEAELTVECRALSRTVLLGWEGVDRGGAPLLYSTEAAESMLRRVPVLRRLVRHTAASFEPYRYDLASDEEALGNSETPSAGN